MPWFRRSSDDLNAHAETPLSAENIDRVISERMALAHFFASPGLVLVGKPRVVEEIPWEIFQGHLLDPAHTRLRQRFVAWNIYRTSAATPAEPLLAVKWDPDRGEVHVVRSIFCFAWEGYHAGDNVFLSREIPKWVRELVGTIHLHRLATLRELADELTCYLFHAVVGTSRLPLTSVEAPMPDFSLGALGYCHRPLGKDEGASGVPMREPEHLLAQALHPQLSRSERTKLLELLLRATPETRLRAVAAHFGRRWQELGRSTAELPRLFRDLFAEVALLPYTDFVPKTFAFLSYLVEGGRITPEQQIDFCSHLIRQIVRHLTAYDLVVFHHQGANYPDILLLDCALKTYLARIEHQPAHRLPADSDTEAAAAAKRRRRRALRQGWLLRRHYEGHPVPDAPTSPGENARILPPPHSRVPDEQIADPAKRTKRLFAGDPLDGYLRSNGRAIFRQSIRDLDHPEEFRELGMALFLDRPLGVAKMSAEPDQTMLFSYEAFSRSIARQRLQELAGQWSLLTAGEEATCIQQQQRLNVPGVEPPVRGVRSHPGKVSLEDARRAANDFVLLRTTTRSVGEFLALFDFSRLDRSVKGDWFAPDRSLLILRREPERDGDGNLLILDAQFRQRLELRVDAGLGYESRGGIEYPVAGLQIIRCWQPAAGDELQEFSGRDMARITVRY